MKKIHRIRQIEAIEGFNVICIFTNDEVRLLNFEKIFEKWNILPNDVEYPLLKLQEFQKIKVQNGTFAWDNIKVVVTDEAGIERTEDYEIDPVVLYKESVKIEEVEIH